MHFLSIGVKNGIKNHTFLEAALRRTNLLFPPRRGCLLERWEWFWFLPADFGLKFVEFIIIRRIEEPIGKDRREVTNQSNEEIEREMQLSREWTFKYSIQQEVSRKITDVNSIQMRDGANRSRTIEDFFREQYSYEKGQKIISTETVRIKIPGKKKIVLQFLWKNIIEIGSIVLRDSKENEFILPYNAIVGVTFDLNQSEISL